MRHFLKLKQSEKQIQTRFRNVFSFQFALVLIGLGPIQVLIGLIGLAEVTVIFMLEDDERF